MTAQDVDRISEWERRTGKTLAQTRRENRMWDNIGSSDVPF